MNQTSFDLNLSMMKTRRRFFRREMRQIVPWQALVELIAPYYLEGRMGRPSFTLETMLRIHCMQQGSALSDLAMQEAFFDTPLYLDFSGLDAHGRTPNESTILRFLRRLEKHKLTEQTLRVVNELLQLHGLLFKEGSDVDATLIAAAPFTKNQAKSRDPERYHSKKGKQWYFGTRAHIGVDADSGLMHTVRFTSNLKSP